jgi:hypothetical protein
VEAGDLFFKEKTELAWHVGMYDCTVGGLIEEVHEDLAYAKIRAALMAAECDCERCLKGSNHTYWIFLRETPIEPPPPDGRTIEPGGPRVIRFVHEGRQRKEVHPHAHSYSRRLAVLRQAEAAGEDFHEIVGEHRPESGQAIRGHIYNGGVHSQPGVPALRLPQEMAHASVKEHMKGKKAEEGEVWI